MKQLCTVLILSFFSLWCSDSRAENSVSRFSIDQIHADFDQLYASLKNAHIKLFANIGESDYDRAFKQSKLDIKSPLSKLEAYIAYQKFIALGRVAHARIDFPSDIYSEYREAGGRALPIYVRFNDGRWFIQEDYSGGETSLDGAEILMIDGRSVKSVFEDLSHFISADTDAITESLLEFQLPQYLWMLDVEQHRTRSSYSLSLRQNQTVQTIKVNTASLEQLRERTRQNTKQAESSDKLREFKILDSKIAYLKPGPFYNAEEPSKFWDNTSFVEFTDQAFEEFSKQKSQTLIIDLRKNPGGDNSFSDHLIAWYADKPFKFASQFLIRSSAEAKASNAKRIADSNADNSSASIKLAEGFEKAPYGKVFEFPLTLNEPYSDKRYGGQVVALVDRHSYSNAVSVAAITQDYKFGKVAGEATTDFATTFGSMETFELDNTGFVVGFPKSHIIRPSGDTKPGPVIPDILLESDPSKDGDAMLEQLVMELK